MLCGVSGQPRSVRTFAVTAPVHLSSCSPRCPTPFRAVLGTGLQYGPLIKNKNKQTPPFLQPPGSSRSRSVPPAPGRDRHHRERARRWVGGSGGAGGARGCPRGGVPEALPRAGVSLRAGAAISAAPAPRRSGRAPTASRFPLGSRPAAVNTELSCFSR